MPETYGYVRAIRPRELLTQKALTGRHSLLSLIRGPNQGLRPDTVQALSPV